MKVTLRLFVLAAALALVGVARAQTVTWSSTAASGDFLDGTNWVGGVAPTPGANIVFPLSTNQSLLLTSAVTVGNITFNGIQDGFYINSDGGSIALNGNIATTVTPPSAYWGLIAAPITLSATSHTMATGGTSEVGADIYLTGTVDGAGSILKTGDRLLALFGSNTFTGGVTVTDGTLSVSNASSLGTGTLYLLGGKLATSDWNGTGTVSLSNAIELGGSVSFLAGSDSYSPWLNLSGPIKAASGVTDVHLKANGSFLQITGSLADGTSGATTYRFEDGKFYLSGANTYTGGTEIRDGAFVVIEYGASLPATGLVSAQADGYLGLADSESFPMVDPFLARLDKPNFKGTIGFDYSNTFAGNLDLTGFDSGVSIGTITSAFLSAPITPVGGAYRFRVAGRLNLTSPVGLSGSNDLDVSGFPNQPSGGVIVSNLAPSTYTGTTNVDGAGLVFDSPGSLPSTTIININNGGYVSVTETSGTSFAGLLNQIGGYGTAIVGVDESSQANGSSYGPYIYSSPVDLGPLASPIYLGSATYTRFSGLISTTDDDLDDYFLSGFSSGYVQIDSTLSGSRALHVGVPGAVQDVASDDYSTVYLAAAGNTYTGGTVLNSGRLILGSATSVGSGDITINPQASDSSVELDLPSSATLANNLNLAGGTARIRGATSTLTGIVSGSGEIEIRGSVTLAAANTFTGHVDVNNADLTIANNNATGGASVELSYGGDLSLQALAPVIHDLGGGSPYDWDGYDYSYVTFNGGGPTVNVTLDQSTDGSFYGAFMNGSSAGTLTKTGSGTLTIYGLHDYYDTPFNGSVTIQQGKLVAGSNDALGSGTITINGGELGTGSYVTLTNSIVFGGSGGRLGGNGTFVTPITVGANVVLAPGFSPGTLTFTSGLTLAGGGELEFQVQSANGAAGTGYDLVSVSNGLLDITATSGSPFTIKLQSLDGLGNAGNVSDFSPGNGYSWMLFQGNVAGGIAGFSPANFTIDASGFTNSLGGGTFSLSLGTFGSDPAIFLNFSPVPEPSTYALLGLGVVSGALLRRRRR